MFHTNCIIRWFREPYVSGKCPLCLDHPTKNIKLNYYGYNINSYIIDSRYIFLKKYHKKNKDNKNLEKKIKKIKHLEDDYSIIKNNIKIFHKNENYINIKNKSNELSKKLRNKKKQLTNHKCKLFVEYPTITI